MGAGIEHEGLLEERSEYLNYKLKFISVLAHNLENWYILDQAVMTYGWTLAPLYTTLGPDSIKYIMN